MFELHFALKQFSQFWGNPAAYEFKIPCRQCVANLQIPAILNFKNMFAASKTRQKPVVHVIC